MGDDQAPGLECAYGEPDAGAEIPDGAGDVRSREAAKPQVTLEQGCRHEPKCREPDGDSEDANHPRVGVHTDPFRENGRAGEDHDGGGNGHQRKVHGEHRAQVGPAGIVLALDQAGMQADIRELLDDAGEEGDRDDDAEVGRREQTVEGNVAGERHELHAALTHAKGDHAAHGALA